MLSVLLHIQRDLALKLNFLKAYVRSECPLIRIDSREISFLREVLIILGGILLFNLRAGIKHLRR
jgi:hypothetical protein